MKSSISHRFQYIFLVSIAAIVAISPVVWAEGDQGYIYGKITMENGNVYQGLIRWGDEEAFWDDMFNSTKVDNIFEEVLYDLNIDDLEDELYAESRKRRSRRRTVFNISFWEDRLGETEHQFKCRFGDIRKMRLRGRESILLILRNGEEMRLSGGSNDVGASLLVLDEELDEVKLKWMRIESIEFMPTPRKLKQKLGNALYGEVETRRGTFRGFIQWDHDECLDTDILDGDSEDGDMKIRFVNIRSIEKYRRGSLVTLKSGREVYLTGSNDVNSGNRGVVIKDPQLGKVLVNWRAFDKLTFLDTRDSGPAYSDFQKPQRLSGVVTTKDEEVYSGRLIYDLDEIYDLEILDGQDGDIEYLIPFRNIKRITPRSSWGSKVELRNGEILEMEDSRDIDEDNDGIVVVETDDKAKYIPWRHIREIAFD